MKVVNLIKRDGRVACSVSLDFLFSTLKNGDYILTIKRSNKKRSTNQNDLMWMWFSCIEHETGTSKEDVYLYYCKKFLCKVVQIGLQLEKVHRSSSMLSSAEMSEFLNKIQADAASEFGIMLPLPEDRYFEDFYNEYSGRI